MSPYDPLENELRSLRPGPLPDGLRQRLASPPEMASEIESAPHWQWWTAVGSAAAAVVFTLFFQGGSPSITSSPLASSRSERFIDARSLGFVDDGSRRAWELVELEFLDEETLVSTNGTLAMQTQTVRRQIVPVELHFD